MILTREKKRSRTYRNAELYNDMGYNLIPEDETKLYDNNSINKITNIMRDLRINKDTLDELHLRPIKKGRREPIVKVGSVYLKDLKSLHEEGLVRK
tara:strand:+ start:155 stop:442 length:288 start_codon:yes stop_codon:yes gene_type:complete